jgi:death-on-curing protein
MMDVEDVLNVHRILIERFGGADGVRDIGALESALARPYATFGGQDLYPEAIDKAAALLESIAINHPFIDGNKRSAYVLARLLLMQKGFDISATHDEKYKMIIAVAEGKYRFEEIRQWLLQNTAYKKE